MPDPATPPPITPSQAETLVRRHFAVSGRADRLPGYEDDNFAVRGEDGRRYVFKIAARSATLDILHMQNQAMLHLARRLPNLASSRPVVDEDGHHVASLQEPDGTTRYLRLLTWVAGTPWIEFSHQGEALRRDLGRVLAEVDLALMDFDHPSSRREIIWDLRHVSSLWHLTALVDDGPRRAMVEHFLLRFETEALPRLALCRRSVIHNDANEQNIMVVGDAPDTRRVGGLIDFGDLVQSHTICELAICIAYVFLHGGDLDAVDAVVAGYHDVLALEGHEIDLLYHLLAGRLVTSVLCSTEGALRQPENAYLLASQAKAWQALETLMGVEPEALAHRLREACGLPSQRPEATEPQRILQGRKRHFGRNLSLSYRQPLTILRGSRQFLFDQRGRPYLDLVNNVCHVGHAHPRVVRAIGRQAAILNTNTRYLHPLLVEYVDRLTATFPSPLDVVFLCCTGSEANDLALRLARNVTGRRRLVVADAAYHGHTAALIEASPYKFDSVGGCGRADHIHVVPCPDVYRGPHRGPQAGADYADSVRRAMATAAQDGGAAAFIIESLLGCGGQIEPPPGYLQEAFAHARAAGAICICDEVQVGFGRVGSHMWGFEAQGVVPDIVTLGKPIGNGHPLSAVITTAAIADAFDNGMEYFNTFGGNPVSCAAGLAVLDVVRDEGLQDNARQVGTHFLRGLGELAHRHGAIGDVRGRGLFLGVELVRHRDSRQADPETAARVVEEMKKEGILLSTDGPLHNVLKIKPPLVVTRNDAERVIETLDRVLTAMDSTTMPSPP